MLESFAEYGYWGLFATAFSAATILPIGSEPLFAAMIISGFNVPLCLFAASVGNWLGGMTNYWLGRMGKIEWARKYLKAKPKTIHKVQKILETKGAWMAFFSFLPFIGDLIAFGLGFMRANIYIVNFAMFLGKFCRYALIAYGLT